MMFANRARKPCISSRTHDFNQSSMRCSDTRPNNMLIVNGTACIRHQCSRKTAALSCHRLLINSGVEKSNNI
jgi:hypothetical protein